MRSDVGLLAGLVQRGEARERVLRRGCRAALGTSVVVARRERAGAGRHVVRPRHPGAIQQPRDVGPRVDRRLAVVEPLLLLFEVHVRDARHRIAGVEAARRPRGDQEQVRGQRPAVGRGEHPVLQDEGVRVGPVVRDVAPVDVAHHVRLEVGADERRAGRRGAVDAPPFGLRQRLDEAVHRAARHPRDRGRPVVRAADEAIARRVVHAGRAAEDRVGHAVHGTPASEREPVGARIGPEVVIERPVLLHDEDQVVELEDPVGLGRRRRRAGATVSPCVRRNSARTRRASRRGHPRARAPARRGPARPRRRSRSSAGERCRGGSGEGASSAFEHIPRISRIGSGKRGRSDVARRRDRPRSMRRSCA